jgi:hypothetical protein
VGDEALGVEPSRVDAERAGEQLAATLPELLEQPPALTGCKPAAGAARQITESARAERTQRNLAEYESDPLLYSKSVYHSPKEV